MANEVMESVVRVATLTGTRTGWNTQKMADTFKNRTWLEMSFNNCQGRFIPDTEVKSLRLRRNSSADDSYEDWLRRTTSEKSESEVNIQFGEFTLKKHRVEVLRGSIANMRVCVAVFGKAFASSGIASAEVLHTSNRLWYRLVGSRHDLQMWKADDRVPEINKFTRRFPSGLKKDEQWINSILSPCQSRRFQNLALFLPSGKVFGKNAQLLDWLDI